MKITGIALILMGVMLLLLGGIQYMGADSPTGDLASWYPLNPTFTFVMAAGSLIAGTLVLRYGGRGYSETSSGQQPGSCPPPK